VHTLQEIAAERQANNRTGNQLSSMSKESEEKKDELTRITDLPVPNSLTIGQATLLLWNPMHPHGAWPGPRLDTKSRKKPFFAFKAYWAYTTSPPFSSN
jgi:hypothetical protein